MKSLFILDIKDIELSIVFVGVARMRSINKKFLKHDCVTDVITFNHGEIVICPSVAFYNAHRHGISYAKEILLYVIHGILHLAGFNYKGPCEIKIMRQMEQKLLAQI